VAELVLHGAEDLTAVFEGLCVGDLQFDGEFGYRHVVRVPPSPIGGILGVKLLFCSTWRRGVAAKYCK
jgi:hypothetical protein